MILHAGNTNINDFLGNWLSHRAGSGDWIPNSGHCFGWWREGNLTAVASVRQHNGTSAYVDLAVEGRYFPKELIRLLGDYTFLQLKCKALILVTDSTNLPAQRLHKALGATLEAVLKGVAKGGADSHISLLTPDNCLIWRKLSGQGRSTGTAGLYGPGQQAGTDQSADSGAAEQQRQDQSAGPDGFIDLV